MRQNTPMAKAHLPRHVLRCAMEPTPTRSWNWLPHKIPASTSLLRWRCGETVSGPFVGSTGDLLTRFIGWSKLTANQRKPESITWSLVTGLLWCLCTNSSFGANEKKNPVIRIDLLGVKLIWFLCHIGTLHVDSHGSRQLNNVTYRKYISRRYAVILVLFKSNKLLIPCIRCQTH